MVPAGSGIGRNALYSLRRRHGPRTLFDSLTLSTAKRRHSAARRWKRWGVPKSGGDVYVRVPLFPVPSLFPVLRVKPSNGGD